MKLAFRSMLSHAHPPTSISVKGFSNFAFTLNYANDENLEFIDEKWILHIASLIRKVRRE
jgi:hypothetical protein